MQQRKDVSKILTGEGQRSTKQRRAILVMLTRSEKPVTAEDIYLKLKEEGIPTSLSTVYRNLEMLTSKRLVAKSTMMGDGKARYELQHPEHRHHLVCMGCSKVVSIDDCPMKELEKKLQKNTDFDVTGHRLEVYGYCPDCKMKEQGR